MTTTSSVPTNARPLVEAYWPADRSVGLIDETIGSLLAGRAAAHPGRAALVGVRHGSGIIERLTYAELFDESTQVATALTQLVRPGSFVALWAPNVIEWTIIQYGAALAGMVLVALNPVLREGDLDYALRHSGAELLLHADHSREYAMCEVAERVCAAIPGTRRISLAQVDVWKSDAAAFRGNWVTPTDAETPAMLQYTSGTTGRPKGVLLSHRALVNVAKLTMEAVQVPPAAKCVNPLPLFHTAGCVIATLGPLWVAGTVVLCERFAPGPVLATLRQERPAVLLYVPTVLRSLLDHQRASAEPAPQVPIIMGGASDVSAELIDGAAATFGASVFNLYGQTELAPVLTLTRPRDSREDRLTTVGRPLPQVECKIVDPEDGRTLPVGEKGEICARGYQQFIEYLHDPDATAEALDAEGFVRTGDLGTMDDRGFVTVGGRLKELIIRGGENISPAEIEQLVAGHESVDEAVAVGLPDTYLGETVAVVCRLVASHRSGLKESLDAHIRARAAAFKVPARWFVVDQFPVTPTGKVRRFALREAILSNELQEL
ncbi:class I adenylate-forming enzyme family protein [Mycobacterium sp. 050134]|uniref:class I adenylate-forming enzyme family protein n=1 Tax=Mycobacterium sp. 050134 TaxID=3096111 RepID=UPI002ED7F116